jgi:hypothetical protein
MRENPRVTRGSNIFEPEPAGFEKVGFRKPYSGKMEKVNEQNLMFGCSKNLKNIFLLISIKD